MATSSSALTTAQLQNLSVQIRRETFSLAHGAGCGHLGPAFSIVEILVALYFNYLNIDPTKRDDVDRDRFILSKGHGCSSLYVTLGERGFYPKKALEGYLVDDGQFPGHPSSHLIPGIELSTGSLGHGLPVGAGMALAAKRDEKDHRIVVLISDGECDEGSTWEAILSSAHWELGNLTCIVDYNKIQSFGRVSDVMELEPFTDKWKAFRWHVQEVDGHNHEEILTALNEAEKVTDKPSVIIAHTVKGKGVSFMEDTVDWHYWTPTDDHHKQAMEELS